MNIVKLERLHNCDKYKVWFDDGQVMEVTLEHWQVTNMHNPMVMPEMKMTMGKIKDLTIDEEQAFEKAYDEAYPPTFVTLDTSKLWNELTPKTEEPKHKCKCDLKGPNCWLGCRCGGS